jgi:hypothetical protein
MAHHLVDLARLPESELEHVLRYGEPVDFAAIDGFLFHGANLVPPGQWLFPKFVKGFFTEKRLDGSGVSKGHPTGYNIGAARGSLAEPWHLLPDPQRPKPFGFFECRTIGVGERLSLYPGSLLLDYGRGGNGISPTRLLRDYLVQVEAPNKDLYLGKAYLDLGVLVPAGFFALERWAKAPPAPPR